MPKFSLPVYVINLPRSITRRKKCLEQLNQLGIKPKFIAAHDGHSPTFPFHRYNSLLHPFWGQEKLFKPGAFACYLSHAECWKQIANGNSSYGLILEDDIVLNKTAFTSFDFTHYGCEFDVIFLNGRTNRWLEFIEEKQWTDKSLVSLNDVLIEAVNSSQFLKKVPTPGGEGYLVSKKGAAKLLEIMEQYRIDMGVDYAIVFHSITPEGIVKINSLSKENIPNNLLFFLERVSQENIRTEASYLHLNSFIYSGVPLVTVANQKEYPSTLEHSKKTSYDVFKKPLSHYSLEQNNVSTIEGKVVSSNYGKHNISFFVRNEKDVIQKYHAQGKFYEVDDLEIISSTISKPSIVLDIGSNIGNHTIYFAKIMKAEKVICIEPNPIAIDLLKINVSINACLNVDLSYLGIGLSDSIDSCQVYLRSNNNLGATKLGKRKQDNASFNSNSDHIVPVIPGDVLFSSIDINLIKIDVEGMELSVIKGLEKTICKCKPLLFIEITDAHVYQVMEYLAKLGYYVIYQNKQHILNTNYLLTYENC